MPDFLNISTQEYLDKLASGAPTPGGGSAAGLAGSMAAALLSMSAHFTVGRERYQQFEEAAAKVLAEADRLRGKLQRLIEEDAEAYGQYGAATALSKSTEEEKSIRQQALQQATRASAAAPMAISRHCYRLLELAVVLAANCNSNLVSDVAVATELALAAFRSAVLNVRLNLRYLDDKEFVEVMACELGEYVEKAPGLAELALANAYQVMNLPIEGV